MNKTAKLVNALKSARCNADYANLLDFYLNSAVDSAERLGILSVSMAYLSFSLVDLSSEDEVEKYNKLRSKIGDIPFYENLQVLKNTDDMKKVILENPDGVFLDTLPETAAIYFKDKDGKLSGMLFRLEQPTVNFWTVIINARTLISPRKNMTRKEAIEHAIKLGFTPYIP